MNLLQIRHQFLTQQPICLQSYLYIQSNQTNSFIVEYDLLSIKSFNLKTSIEQITKQIAKQVESIICIAKHINIYLYDSLEYVPIYHNYSSLLNAFPYAHQSISNRTSSNWKLLCYPRQYFKLNIIQFQQLLIHHNHQQYISKCNKVLSNIKQNLKQLILKYHNITIVKVGIVDKSMENVPGFHPGLAKICLASQSNKSYVVSEQMEVILFNPYNLITDVQSVFNGYQNVCYCKIQQRKSNYNIDMLIAVWAYNKFVKKEDYRTYLTNQIFLKSMNFFQEQESQQFFRSITIIYLAIRNHPQFKQIQPYQHCSTDDHFINQMMMLRLKQNDDDFLNDISPHFLGYLRKTIDILIDQGLFGKKQQKKPKCKAKKKSFNQIDSD